VTGNYPVNPTQLIGLPYFLTPFGFRTYSINFVSDIEITKLDI